MKPETQNCKLRSEAHCAVRGLTALCVVGRRVPTMFLPAARRSRRSARPRCCCPAATALSWRTKATPDSGCLEESELVGQMPGQT